MTRTARTPLVGAIVFDRAAEADQVLAEVVAGLRLRGVQVAGLLQHFGLRQPCGKRSMWLEKIASGRVRRFDQQRGPGGTGCLLDGDALARAACDLRDSIRAGADLLVINRFGASEADGGGMRAEIAEAIRLGIPVLTAVRRDLLEDWLGFAGAPTPCLSADPVEVLAWTVAAVALAQAG